MRLLRAMTKAEEYRLRAREAEQRANTAKDFEAATTYLKIARHCEAIDELLERGFFHQPPSSSERS